jgi:hypothetical protein
MELTDSQAAALAHIREYAKSRKGAALATIAHILKMSNVSKEAFEKAVVQLKLNSRVALHFHPDRLAPQMKTVAEALLEQGIYKSQFETMLSNGSLSAQPGGERDLWEKQLYGGAYHKKGPDFSDRPRYGALDLFGSYDGPAPRFGSCYFVLKREVSDRCTFTYLDSSRNPDEKGTFEEFDDILAALLEETFTREFALGERSLTVPKLIRYLNESCGPSIKLSRDEPKRSLDHYIEAQVHSVVSLNKDVEKLVADSCFKATETGKFLQEICRTNSIPLAWHPGFALPLHDTPSDFRGPTMPSLAKRVANGGHVDAHMIGVSAADLRANPENWADRGSYKEVLQELKLLWHVLVKFGKPLHTVKST